MARVDLEELERRARHEAEMLDGWHGDPFKRGSWVGHRDHALNVVALIARIRELEMTFGALLAEVEERSENADWYADDRAVLEKGVVTP